MFPPSSLHFWVACACMWQSPCFFVSGKSSGEQEEALAECFWPGIHSEQRHSEKVSPASPPLFCLICTDHQRMKGASQTEQNGFSRRQTLSHKEERSRLKPGYSEQKISLENSWQAPLIRDTCGCAVGGPLVLMLLWSLTCAVYRHVFLQKGPGIPKLMEKILPTY